MKFRVRESTDYLYVHLKNTDGKTAKELHREARREGKLTLGYHYVIQNDGLVEQGREPAVVAGHDFENADRSVYVIVDVGEAFHITDAQRVSLNGLMSSLNAEYPHMKTIVS